MKVRDKITYFHRILLGLGPVQLRSGQNVIELKKSLSNRFYEVEIYEENEFLYAKWAAGDIVFRILFWFMSVFFHFTIVGFLFNLTANIRSAMIMIAGSLILFVISRVFIVSYRPVIGKFL